MGIIRLLGVIIIAGGIWIIYHAATILAGWQYRNRARLGVTDYAPYIEAGFGLCVSLIGIWVALRRQKR
jgi:hypothetical protein